MLPSLSVDTASLSAQTATEYLDQLFSYAIHHGISDIHFEPQLGRLQVRLRQEGLLQLYPEPPFHLIAPILVRLKILATLDIGEKRLPQEGEFTYPAHGSFHARVSTCPAYYGEKIVLRLFPLASTHLELSKLGFSPIQWDMMTRALSQPQGLILVTGPTGSGKSTTLYSALQYLNQSTVNIMTAEDPIEIKMPGITQVGVQAALGLNFATILRSFLRQDPDIIMLGEIRDAETAHLAIQAAQTGHLVLSTLHTIDTFHTLSRLQSLNVETSLLADSLLLVIAQRLLRRASPADKLSDKALGRMAIFEMLPTSLSLSTLIRQNAPLCVLQKTLQNEVISLSQAAEDCVKKGLTSLEEIYRVIGASHAFS